MAREVGPREVVPGIVELKVAGYTAIDSILDVLRRAGVHDDGQVVAFGRCGDGIENG